MSLLALHPTGPWPSLGRGLELSTDLVLLLTLFHLVVTVQKARVGRELGQKPQADAPAKEQSPGHLSLLQTYTQQASQAGGGCRTLHGSHAKRHQQGVLYTHTWLQVPSAFLLLSITKGGRLRGCKRKPLPGLGHRVPPQRTARA